MLKEVVRCAEELWEDAATLPTEQPSPAQRTWQLMPIQISRRSKLQRPSSWHKNVGDLQAGCQEFYLDGDWAATCVQVTVQQEQQSLRMV